MLVGSRVHWDVTADVVTIGYGCAGAVTAITAREAGADVLILEKQPQRSRHTNSSMSGGGFLCPSDVDSGVAYLHALCQAYEGAYWTGKDMIRAWAELTAGNRAWIEARGGSFQKVVVAEYAVPGCESVNRYFFKDKGAGLMKFLSEQVDGKSIPVMYETAARKLLTDSRGRVVGVEAETHSEDGVKRIRVRASRGVALTCGGFEYNESMKLNYLKAYPSYFCGSPANTGDGIKMAQDVGADLWHMNCVSGWVVMKFPEVPQAFYVDLSPGMGRLSDTDTNVSELCGYIFVDRDGKRFTNEDIKTPMHGYYYELAAFDGRRLISPRLPNYWIFDSKRIGMGPIPRPISRFSGSSGLYEWSSDNRREIDKGWIVTGRTIRDLAERLEIPPDVLEKTIANYNGYCQKGLDPDFGRAPSDLVPIKDPPYYAIKLWPGGANTQGGPRRNVNAQVLNTDGEPIPGLYSAGELGSIYGMLYPGAGNLAECLAFGRVAGENAARRSP